MDARGTGQSGFTYILMLVLVLLLSIGALKGEEVVSTAERHDKEQQLLFIGRQFRTAIGSYVQANAGVGLNAYPTDLNDLLEDKRFPNIRRHLRKIYVDPMTGKADWGLLVVGGHIMGVYSQSQAEPLRHAGFLPEEAGFHDAKKYQDWVFAYQPNIAMPLSTPTAGGSVQPPH